MASVPEILPTTDVVTLRVRRPAVADSARICRALDEPSWLGQAVEPPPGTAGDAADAAEAADPASAADPARAASNGTRRFLTDLVFPLPPDGRLLSFRKAAYVDVGRPESLPGGCSVEIAWRSASLAPLFPVFAGRVVVSADGLSLEGHYAPPGGVLGRAADRMLLHTAANGTARWFLDHLVDSAAR